MHSSFPTADAPLARPATAGARAAAWLAAARAGLATRLRGHAVLAGGLLAVAVAGGLALQAHGTLSERTAQADAALRAPAALAELRLQLQAAEAAWRAGTPPQALRAPVQARLEELRQLSADQPEQYSRVLALAPLAAQRLEALERAAAPRAAAANAAAGGWEASDDNRRSSDRVRAALDALDAPATARATEAVALRDAAAATAWQWLALSLALAAAVALVAAQRQAATAARLAKARQAAQATEASLARAAALHQRLMASPLALTALIDAEGRFVHASAATAQLFGIAPQALAGKPLVAFTLPDDVRKTERALAQAASAPQLLQHRVRGADGRVLHLAWSLQAGAEDGTLLALPTDLSAVQALGERLAGQTSARTAAEAALQAASQRAEQAEQRLLELGGTLSRCLKGPLAALERQAEQARAEHGAAPAARAWLQVRERATALQHTLDDVLALGQVHAGQLALQHEAFDLWELVRDGIEATQPMASRKGLALTSRLAEDLGYAHGDTRRVAQALTALLRDAVDAATARSGGELVVVAARTAAGRVAVSVTHERSAADPPSIDGLLAPLQDPDLPCPPERSAQLLGLAMARGLAQRMGGELGAAWAADGRCTLTLALPADELPGR